MSYTSPNRTWVVGETVTAAIMNQYVRDQMNAIGRLGKYDYLMLASAGAGVLNIIDVGWAECNGAQFSRATYPEFDALLAALAPARPFGAGNGTTTSNLPDMFGRVAVGHGSNADVDTLGDNEGVAASGRGPRHNSSFALTLPNHGHDVPNMSNDGAAGGGNNFVGVDHAPSTSAVTGNPTTLPAIPGSIGPGGTRPVDSGAYVVGGMWVVKVKP